MFNITLPRQ